MAKKKYDVCVGQQGKDQKTHWKQIGVVIEGDKGLSLKLEMIPTWNWDGWAVLFEPKAKEGQTSRGGGKEEDIPFSPLRKAESSLL